MSDADEPQRAITRVALRSLDGTSFALAGSGAIREHGLVDRPTEDVELFTSDVDLPRFSSAVDAVVLGLREAGHDVAVLRRVDQFARLEVTTADGHRVDIDMGVDWREAEPAVLAIGPVLSLVAADPGRVEVVDCGLEVDDDPGARSVGQVEDLVDLFTLGDDPLVGADGTDAVAEANER